MLLKVVLVLSFINIIWGLVSYNKMIPNYS
jgi:hypothetical protein